MLYNSNRLRFDDDISYGEAVDTQLTPPPAADQTPLVDQAQAPIFFRESPPQDSAVSPSIPELMAVAPTARPEAPRASAPAAADWVYPWQFRAVDICVALAAIAFFAPLMILVVLAIRAEGKGPILFGHSRLGRDGKPFQCLKFRSMAVDAEARLADILSRDPDAALEWRRTQKLRVDPRITRVGNILRRTSLDELPQLFNVLRGEMSIVGPRPIVTDEVRRYGRYFRYYCQVPPGITGLWQVSGRSDVDYTKRVALDVLYVRSRCVALNVRIIAATIPSVLRAQGSC